MSLLFCSRCFSDLSETAEFVIWPNLSRISTSWSECDSCSLALPSRLRTTAVVRGGSPGFAMGKIASKIWSKGLLGGFGIPAMTKALEPLASWSRTDLIDAYQHFLDYCDETVDRHVSWTSLRWVYGEAISQATRPTISRPNRRWFSIIFRCQTNPCCCWYLIKSIKAHPSNCSKHIHISPQYIFQHHHFTPPHFIWATVPSKKDRNEIINITMSPGFSWIFMDFPLFSISPTPKLCSKHPRFNPLRFGCAPPIPSGPLRSPKEFTDVFQCFGDTMKADAAFQALKPKKGKSDGNTLFAAAVATSNQSFISKVGECWDEDHENHGETKEKLL